MSQTPSAKTIRAVRYHSYGDPDVLQVEDVPAPSITAGQVLVSVVAAGVGGGEPGIRAGDLRRVLRQKLPAGTGVDFSGRVAAIGQGIKGLQIGDAVWGVMPHGTFGAVAEQIAIPANRVAIAPTEIDLVDAAALPAAGTTALRALQGLNPSDRLLVRGAAGGVGNVAVQLGHALGVSVTALASSRDADWLRSLGADQVFDYRTTPLSELGEYHRIIDLVGTDLLLLRRQLAPGGSLYALALDMRRPIKTFGAIVAGSVGRRRIRTFSNDPAPEAFAQLRSYVEAGHLTPVVHSRNPLGYASEAHRLIERGGIRGKILLTP